MTESSTNLAFDFGKRDGLVEEEEAEEADEPDFIFLRLCFFGIEGRSVGGMSLNISDAVCRPMDSP